MSKSFPGALDSSFERKKETDPKLLAGCHAVIILPESEQENIAENREFFELLNLKTLGNKLIYENYPSSFGSPFKNKKGTNAKVLSAFGMRLESLLEYKEANIPRT